jgi:hypothetical protein
MAPRRKLRNLLFRGRRARQHARGVRPDVGIPFDMFKEVRNAKEEVSAKKLAGIYHKGQSKSWDGKEVLDGLVEEHGGVQLPPEARQAVRKVFAVILWGELAAWKISADLALQLEPLEAKMAATSQAHDEARHFYVMHDYLSLLGDVPTELGPAATRVFDGTLGANTLYKKLMGMQMMIEPMALTIFQAMREHQLDPVLSDLLRFYERDEARHVALGVLHLPKLLKRLTLAEAVDLGSWQFREYWAQVNLVRELEQDFEALGISTHKILELGRNKQVRAQLMLVEELGYNPAMQRVFMRFFDAKMAWDFPKNCTRSQYRKRLSEAWHAAGVGIGDVPEDLTNVDPIAAK